MAEPTKKPSWSMDVKIISHLSDMLDMASDMGEALENGDANQLFALKNKLQEIFLKMGGMFDETEGNMILPEMRERLVNQFKLVEDWERANQESLLSGKIPAEPFRQIRDLLRDIRGILYVENNRLFIKFITIWSETDKAQRYSQRTG